MKKVWGAFLVFVICFRVYAIQLNPTTDKFYSIEDFSGGLNTQRSPGNLPPSQSPKMENCLIDESPGSIVKRNGFTIAGSTPTLTKINFMMEYVNPSNKRELLISDSSQVLTTKDFINFTVIKTTLSASAVLHGTQGRGKALLCNGTDPCFFYDGTKAAFLDGTNGYPSVLGTFPIFYLDRFWVGKTTASNSALIYSENTSTDGFAIDPMTDNRAWPAQNQLNIGLGDGRAISGEDTLRNILQVHKENGAIYTVFGTDNFTWTVKRTVGNFIGTVSADSIIQTDNFENYIGKDGVYNFDSVNATRISDDIFPDVQAVINSIASIKDNTWDSQLDFQAQGLATLAGTTITPSGFVQPLVNQQVNIDTSAMPDNTIGTIQFLSPSGSTTSGRVPFTMPYLDPTQNYIGYISTIQFSLKSGGFDPGIFSTNVVFSIIDTISNTVSTGAILSFPNHSDIHLIGQAGGDNACCDIDFMKYSSYTSGPAYINTAHVLSGNVFWKLDLDSRTWTNFTGTDARFKYFNIPGIGDISINSTTGAYTSQITTVTNITFWDKFNTVHNSNSGTVSFYIKGGTAAYGSISTEAWTSITPGSFITIPTNKNYVQWTATLTAVSNSNVSNIDQVVINHNEGGALETRPIGIEWKKRYWLLVSTQNNSNSTLIYVKSRATNANPNAWMKFTGLNLRSLARFGDKLYGGSSSSGTIFQLDNGLDDNGAAISMIYRTPEEPLGDTFMNKKLLMEMVDVDQTSGATLTIGTSINRAAFTPFNFSIDGTGRQLKSIYSFPYGSNQSFFQFEFSNNELDKPIAINGFGIYYQPSLVPPQ